MVGDLSGHFAEGRASGRSTTTLVRSLRQFVFLKRRPSYSRSAAAPVAKYAGGASLNAADVTVATSGNSSAAIRSDRGGGTVTVSGGTYDTTGVGSPAIYSTADITTLNAKLISAASEGVVVEGSNSVSLSSTTLTDTNTTLNGNSETYKNIFIYQSMSGDAEEGTGSFFADNSTITTNQGDTFFVTNTTASIVLENNRFINNDQSSAFLRAQAGKWGTTGHNGGDVTLSLRTQVVEGDIILDSLSSLTMELESSYYMGAINPANTAKSVSVTLDTTSNLILTNDTYLTTLTNADPTNTNIYSNGYKLYVAGEEVAVNGSEAPETPEVVTTEETTGDISTDCIGEEGTDCAVVVACKDTLFTECGKLKVSAIVGCVSLLVIIGGIVALLIHNRKGKTPSAPVPPTDIPQPMPPVTPAPPATPSQDSNLA